MRCRHLISIVILMAATAAHGQWRQNGEVVPDEPWRKSDGEFGAMLLLTDKPEAFLEQWSRPAKPGYVPSIKTVGKAKRGDVVAAMILFARCTPAESGKCHSTADFRVTRPDGSVYAEHAGAALWGQAPPARTGLQVAEAHLAFEIEQDDPIGVYKIETTVQDLVGGESVTLSQELTVSP